MIFEYKPRISAPCAPPFNGLIFGSAFKKNDDKTRTDIPQSGKEKIIFKKGKG